MSLVRPVRHASAYVFAVLLTLMLTAVMAGTAAAQQVFDRGHVDAFYVTSEGGNLTLGIKEDVTGTGVVHPGNDVILKVNESAYSTATEGVSGIGAPTYFLPQTQRSDILWPGWDTQPAGKEGFESVDFHFENVSGPGSVYVFETAGFGDIYSVTNSGSLGLASGEVITQDYPAHRHVNWAFTQPGTYTMTVSAHSNGVASNAVTYTWQVADAQSADSGSQGNEAQSGQAQGQSHGQAQGQTQGQAQHHGQAARPSTRESVRPSARSSAAPSSAPSSRPSAAPSAGGTQPPASTASGQLANTGNTLMTAGIATLGLGLLVLGLGIARLAAAQANRR